MLFLYDTIISKLISVDVDMDNSNTLFLVAQNA